jgi:methylmalonyl-CoA/ethylmalonyl-CoA epimerase
MRIHHLGLAVRNMEIAVESHCEIFGYRLLSDPVDDPIQGVAVCFLAESEGDEIQLELVTPLKDKSPVDGFLKKNIGAYHACYEVADVAETMETMRSQKCHILSGPTPAVAFGGRPIAWLYTPAFMLVELVEAEKDNQANRVGP